ncbi:putative Oil body-associated protein [Helianthus annuus]|nr:putative Oil body-associated protein [Helianthus annuus]
MLKIRDFEQETLYVISKLIASMGNLSALYHPLSPVAAVSPNPTSPAPLTRSTVTFPMILLTLNVAKIAKKVSIFDIFYSKSINQIETEIGIPIITFRRSGDEDVTISDTSKRRRLVLPIIMSIWCLFMWSINDSSSSDLKTMAQTGISARLHLYADDMTGQVEAHHYCGHLSEEMRQCLIYNRPDVDARLIGLEYKVTEELFLAIPDTEKPMWHSHEYEVTSSVLFLSGFGSPG